MFKINTFTLTLVTLLILSSASSPCSAPNFQGSVYSTQITAALDGGSIPFVDGLDTTCFNYSLPYAFNNVPTVAVSIHSFSAQSSNGLYFFIKPLHTDSLIAIPIVIRTQWPYTQWSQISFSIFAEDRNDIQSGYYQIDSGILSNCDLGKSINFVLPFVNRFTGAAEVRHSVFLHGFQIATYKNQDGSRSPFELEIPKTTATNTGIQLIITVTTITQVNYIYVSFIASQKSSLQIVGGGYLYDATEAQNTGLIYSPSSLIPRNFARIFGFNGFLLNYQANQKVQFDTKWDGINFNFIFQNGNPQNLKYLSFSYIFFVGSICQDCAGMQIQYNGTCIGACPLGTYLTTDNTCIDCGAGKIWNGTACIVSCPQGQFLGPNSGICECPPTLNWNGQNCISCFNGRVWVAASKSCECQKPLSWNGFTCAKVDPCTNGKVWDVFTFSCQCPETAYWDQVQCKDLPQCQAGQILNGNYECVCPTGYVWSSNSCIYSPCLGGQVWTGSKCKCPVGLNFNGTMCLECINGQKWDLKSSSCACESGYRWNGQYCEKSFICSNGRIWNPTYQQCICPDGSYWSGFSCLPTQKCTGGQYFDSTIQKCACYAGFNWNGKLCVQCANGRAWNLTTLSCTCPIGTVSVKDGCRFQQQCTGGMQWNQNIWRCQCPSGAVWNGNFCIANPCQGGQIWNETLKSCKCPGNKIFTNQACVPPQISCTNGRVWNQFIYTCACPQGTYAAPTTCDPIPSCPNGRVYNPLNNQCQCPFGLTEVNSVCVNPKCQIGQFWNGYNCQVINCPPPSYFSKDRCVIGQSNKCSFGYIWNGRDCAFAPPTCPQGTLWTSQTCKSTGKCGDGFYSQNDRCSPLPQQCPPNFQFDGSKCSSSNSICPTGTYAQGKKCYPYQACTNGFVWDANYLRCVCPPGTINNGNKCVQCGGDKIWISQIGCSCPQGTFDAGASCQAPDSTKCLAIANTVWNNNKCSCRPGFTKVGFQCICYGTQNGDLCDKCSYKLNSKYVQRSNTCQCQDDYTEINDVCVKKGDQMGNQDPSKCRVSTYFDKNHRSCLPCPAGCLSCIDCYKCKVCAPGFAYDSSTQKCIEMCGDGKRFVLQCDDGNNFDGDGCSKDCRIESSYTCSGGSNDDKDNCYTYKPDSVKIQLLGQIRKTSSVILNLKLNYMPDSLIQSIQCANNCNQVLVGSITEGDKNSVSITSQYLVGTRYVFTMVIQFGRPYISTFKLNARINPTVVKYFGGVGLVSQEFSVQPNYLMSVVNNDTLE